jgi:ubiquinone/menaquinone biosynthesis C-methylase UbiE/predicted Zn-dependent protease with MMP-like domain
MERILEPEYMDTRAEAEAYDEMDHSGPNEAFVLRLFELGAHGRMLDIGTGPAHIPILICDRDPEATVVAIDAAQAMLDRAAQKIAKTPHRSRIELTKADAKKLGFATESFDVVYSNTILHHIPDPKPFLREAWRVLKPGGVLLIRDLFRPENPARVDELVRMYAGSARADQQELFRASLHAAFTPSEVEQMIRDVGIDGVEVVIDTDRHMSIQSPKSESTPRLFLVHPGPRILRRDEDREPIEPQGPSRAREPQQLGSALRPTRWSRRPGRASSEARSLEDTLLRIERLIDRGEGGGEALELLRKLPPGPYLESSFHLRAGDAFFDLGELDDAERHFKEVTTRERRSADALHRLGLIYAEKGMRDRTIDAWLEVRRLDLEAPRPPWALPEEEFVAIAEEALASLPEVVREKLANLPLIATDYPSEDLIREGLDPRLLGLITGVPLPNKAAVGEGAPDLDCVQLYQRNIERVCTTPDELRHEIRITVIHETGHFFGLDDDDLEDLGLG